MANSEVEICNGALVKLGQATINSIDPPESNLRSRSCAVRYDPVRRTMLEMAEWSFATKRVHLSPDSTTPDFGWSYQIQMPGDFLKFSYAFPLQTPFKKEGRKILTDSNGIDLTYIYDVKDTGLFSGLFSEMFATYLAYDMSRLFTGPGRATREELWVSFRLLAGKALSADASESPAGKFGYFDGKVDQFGDAYRSRLQSSGVPQNMNYLA